MTLILTFPICTFVSQIKTVDDCKFKLLFFGVIVEVIQTFRGCKAKSYLLKGNLIDSTVLNTSCHYPVPKGHLGHVHFHLQSIFCIKSPFMLI